MDDTSKPGTLRAITNTTADLTASTIRLPEFNDETVIGDLDDECDAEAWETLSSSLVRAQSVLDRNGKLISQVNQNHQSKVPANLAKNVGLIREINSNISNVLSIYSDLSLNFSNILRQRVAEKNGYIGTGSCKEELLTRSIEE